MLIVNSITVSLPRSRLTGCSCKSPLAHFYIHHAGSSIRELHPFTTITPLAAQNAATPAADDSFEVQFLFRKAGKASYSGKNARYNALRSLVGLSLKREKGVQNTEWTNKLADLVHQDNPFAKPPVESPSKKDDMELESHVMAPFHDSSPKINISLRLEGPYFSPAYPSSYSTVVCLVAGTGISGAIAVVGAFTEVQRLRAIAKGGDTCCASGAATVPWQKCVVIWTVRSEDWIELPFLDTLSGLEVQTHLTGQRRPRIDMYNKLMRLREGNPEGSMWVYISGPKAFIDAGKTACKAINNVNIYAPSWDT
ncbi:MAG: hypothetical protein Q9187_009058 [Circinaria calcarea]